MYPVCPHRNVPAAFERFLGPDSGGIERFFLHKASQRPDSTLLIVTVQQKLRGAGEGVSQAVTDFNAALWTAWTASAIAIWFAGRASSAVSLSLGKEAAVFIRRWASVLFASRPMRLPA